MGHFNIDRGATGRDCEFLLETMSAGTPSTGETTTGGGPAKPRRGEGGPAGGSKVCNVQSQVEEPPPVGIRGKKRVKT